ncbi:MAG: AzlD domain-containing protein [Tissierella sp.]|uniref:AzlD domain-containing protein n=1 Tax=Tissierella sp. TaxID=41274 RepID=UPI003F9D879F
MNYIILIFGMALVTYLPRLIPLMVLKKSETNKNIKLFLTFIPYTSLSILIIRGILTSASDMKIPTIIGILTASFIAYIQNNLIFSVMGGIIAAFISINLLGL